MHTLGDSIFGAALLAVVDAPMSVNVGTWWRPAYEVLDALRAGDTDRARRILGRVLHRHRM